MEKRFPVYKGLQKPLVFKGFKGKFIYWGVGILLGSLALGALTMSLLNMWLGAIVLTITITTGFLYIADKQKRGLHTKTKHTGVYVHPVNLKKNDHYGREKGI